MVNAQEEWEKGKHTELGNKDTERRRKFLFIGHDIGHNWPARKERRKNTEKSGDAPTPEPKMENQKRAEKWEKKKQVINSKEKRGFILV